jgi:hypothetical protein
MKPVEVEIVYPLITAVAFGCARCSPLTGQVGWGAAYAESCRDEFPEDVKQGLELLSEWVGRASRLYMHRLEIRVIDAHSPLGIWKRLRHGFTGLPAFIIAKKRVHTGWDSKQLEDIIDTQLAEVSQHSCSPVRTRSEKITG